MKKLTAIFVTATLLLNAITPTLALAATYLQGAEVNANTLVRDAYVQVTYYDSNAEQKLAKGWIDTMGETSFTIREGGFKGKKTIAYDKVVSVIMSDESTVPAKQMNEVNRFIREMKNREIEQTKKEKEAKEEQIKREAEQAAIQRFKQRLKDKIVMIGQFDFSKREWYAHVVYTSKEGDKRTAIGQIIKQDTDHIVIRVQEKGGLKIRKTIAYTDIDTLLVARQPQDIEEWLNARQATKLLNQKAVLIMSRGQIDLSKVTTGWYAHVVYTSEEGTKRTTTGQVMEKGTDHILIRVEDEALKSWQTIAYRDVDILVIAQHTRDIEEWKNARQTQRHREQPMQKFYAGEPRVRVYAPSIRKGWMVGKLIKMTQDTLVVRGELTLYGRRFYQVPLSSISNFEVSTGQHRNTFKGMVIGCGISLAISTAYHSALAGQFAPLLPSSNRGRIIFIGPIFICALVGAMTKSDKWGEVSPQSLNLSLAPTSSKGLRAALAFNF